MMMMRGAGGQQRPGGSGGQGAGQGAGPMGRGGPMAGFGMPVQKAKNFRGTLRRLLTYFARERLRLALVLAAAVLSSTFNILGPKILGMAVTKLYEGFASKVAQTLYHIPSPGIDVAYIEGVLLILAGLYVVSSLFGYVQQYTMAGVAQRVVYRMRRQVDEKLARLPLKFYDGRTHGEIMSRAVNDMDNISNTLQQSLTQLITSVVTFVGVIVLMLTISWLLTLVVLVTFPLSIFVTMLLAKRSQKYFARQQRSLGELNGHVEEMLTGHTIVKAFGREDESIAKFDELNDKLYEAGWRAQFVSGMIFPLMMAIGNIGFVLVTVVGAILVAGGGLTVGDAFVSFIQYARQFSQPITQLASIANTIQLTIASAERVFELLDEGEETSEPVNPPVVAEPVGAVRLQQVDFSYTDKPLIEDMNIDVRPGQMVAIVGPTGAGKTTLVNLLMRFYDVNSGQIVVDGVPITELRRGDLRRMFGMVLQDTWLFNGTIRDNIAYGREGATEGQIVTAATAAQADHFIRTLPEGYETVLNQEASNISQGQKQLLTIARAFLADPEILILDEATSSVDTRTEILIQRAMSELMKGRTAFVIAHRLSTIRGADVILVMNHGRIVEQGTHEGLLAKGGFYANLYNSQFTAHTSVIEALQPALAEETPAQATKGEEEPVLVGAGPTYGNGQTWPESDPVAVTAAAALAEMPPLVPLEVDQTEVPVGNGYTASNGNGHADSSELNGYSAHNGASESSGTNGNAHAKSNSNGHTPAPAEKPMLLERRVFARTAPLRPHSKPPASLVSAQDPSERTKEPVVD
jgi:ATP-binding cassette subfamily B protein